MQVARIAQHPAWFAAVMGTGVVGVATVAVGDAFDVAGPAVTAFASIFVLLGSLLAVVFTPRYLRRILPAGRSQLARELHDPTAGAMLGTVPGGILVLAVAWPRVLGAPLGDSAYLVGGVLTLIGALLAVVVSLAWAAAIADNETPQLTHVSGGWFIPPVVNVLVPLAMAPYLTRNDAWAEHLFVLALLFWGAGILLFLTVLPLLVARLALAPPAPAMMAAAQWIPLAPAGIGGVAILRLSQQANAAGLVTDSVVTLAAMGAAGLAGFGIWYTFLAAGFTRRYRKAGPIPFHPGWWAFTFPLGAMTVSLALLGTYWQTTALAVVALGYGIGLIAVWLLVARRSLVAVRTEAKTKSVSA